MTAKLKSRANWFLTAQKVRLPSLSTKQAQDAQVRGTPPVSLPAIGGSYSYEDGKLIRDGMVVASRGEDRA